jgi:phosphoribosylanthranilate isomerase
MASLRIKICGVMDPSEGREAALLGADAIGLNFYPQSPRCLTPDAARAVVRALPPFVEAVGLFVNVPLRQAFAALEPAGVRVVQWYGTEHEVCDAFPGRVIPTFPVGDADDLAAITRHLDRCREHGPAYLPHAVLVDARVQGQWGGTGHPVPWKLLADFRPGVPLILAGGLTPDNVAEAVRIVRPYGVDVASGVEVSPGRKDMEKVRRFLANAREAAAALLQIADCRLQIGD